MFADRAKFLGDPEFVDVPAGRAAGQGLRPQAARVGDTHGRGWAVRKAATPCPSYVGPHHAPDDYGRGRLGRFTQTTTLNNSFGGRVVVPGTGLLINNNMALFDPRPGRPNSVGPRKRMLTATAATIVERDGKPFFAIGTPGGIRIFPTVLQGILNVIDHGMNIQEAVEAPRIWASGEYRGVRVGMRPRRRGRTGADGAPR